MKRTSLIFLLLLFACLSAQAQDGRVRKDVRQGNREYRNDRYERAELAYRKALQQDSSYYRAHYNLGNALYRQKNYTEAAQHFEAAMHQPDLSAKTRSQILHNKGNSNLKAGLSKSNRGEGMQDFQQAVNDYQEALKIDPKNEDTRYNLSYAKKLLQQAQQQQQQGGGQDQQQQGNQGNQGNQGDQNQDKQNQNQGQQNQGQQNQDRQNQQDRQNNPQNPEQKRQQQQKKQDAERLLEAVKNNEKNTMKENAKKVEVAKHGRIEKDW